MILCSVAVRSVTCVGLIVFFFCVKPSGGWSKFIEDSMLSLIGSGGAEILDI